MTWVGQHVPVACSDEQRVDGFADVRELRLRESCADESFDVAGVGGSHPASKASSFGGQLNEDDSSIVLVVEAAEEAAVNKTPDDSVA